MNDLQVVNLLSVGAVGYNNAVFLLNDICKKQYSNHELGVSARSINIKDIEEHFTDEARTARDNKEASYPYGSITKITNTRYTYTPDIYNYVSKDNEGESVNYYPNATIETYRQEQNLEAKQTNYILNVSKEYIDNEIVYLLLFKSENNRYFIASRSTEIGGSIIFFHIRAMESSMIKGWKLYTSGNLDYPAGSLGLRPIVRLNRDVQISELGGTETMPRTLSK